MNKRVADILCISLLLLLLSVPILSWVLAALNLPVQSLLTAEGFRWVCMHSLECLVPSYMPAVFAFILSIGFISESGITKQFTHPVSFNEKLGLIAAFVIAMLLVAPVLVPIFNAHSALRGVTGTLVPSPWFTGLPFTLSLVCFFSMLGYSMFASKERFIPIVSRLLRGGLSRNGLWLINVSMFSFLYEMIVFIFS